MHPVLLAWLVAIILHAAVGSATVAMMGATAIVSPLLVLYPDLNPVIVTLAIGSGAIGCTISDRFTVLASKAVYRGNDEANLYVLHHGNLYRISSGSGRNLRLVLRYLILIVDLKQ